MKSPNNIVIIYIFFTLRIPRLFFSIKKIKAAPAFYMRLFTSVLHILLRLKKIPVRQIVSLWHAEAGCSTAD